MPILKSRRNILFYVLLAAISLSGFALRYLACREIFAACELSHSPGPGTDMLTYIELSTRIFQGEFNQAFYFQPLYYAVFLPAVYLLFNTTGVWNVLLAQSVLGALTVWLSGISAAMLRGRRCGILAAFLCALSSMAVFYTAFALIVTLKAFLVSLMILLVLLAIRRGKLLYWVFSGLVCSALFLTRANTLVFLPIIIAMAYLGARKKSQSPPSAPLTAKLSTLSAPIGIIAVFILPLIPFSLHNTRVQGRISPPSTSGAVNLAIGNNPEACPAGLYYTQTSTFWTEHSADVPVSSRIISWFLKDPLAFSELTFRKLLVFWDAGEVFDNIAGYDKITASSRVLSFVPMFPTSFLLACSIAAIVVMAKKIVHDRGVLFAVASLLAYWLAIAAFIHLSRYRLAMLPIFALLSACFLDKAVQSRRRPCSIIFHTATCIAAFLVVFNAYPLYRHNMEKHVIRLIQPKGVRIPLGTDMLLIDNGPRNLGSWHPFPVMPGNTIEKTFAIASSDAGRPGEFHIQLHCNSFDPIHFRLNGMPATSIPNHKNMIFKFRTTIPADGRFVLETLDAAPGAAFAYLDLQRDFRRTSVNESPVKGELVSRIIIRKLD